MDEFPLRMLCILYTLQSYCDYMDARFIQPVRSAPEPFIFMRFFQTYQLTDAYLLTFFPKARKMEDKRNWKEGLTLDQMADKKVCP